MTETIGQRLKRAREYRSLTLEKAASATRIRLQYLQALEEDNFSAMPSPVQARGFLRNYADYLGLDLDQMVGELQNAAPRPAPSQEVVFEGDTSRPEPPAPEEPPSQPGKEKFSLASLLQGWFERLSTKWKAQAEPPGETKSPGDDSAEPPSSSVEEEGQPTPRKTRRKKAPAELEAERQTPTELEREPAGVASMEAASEREAGVEGRPEATPNSVWEPVSAWVRRRFVRRARPVEMEEGAQALEAEQAAPEAEPLPTGVEQPAESAQEIFIAIGNQLRQRREILSLTYGEIERHTRMRAQFLAALEDGRMDDLPSPVQTRGLLSSYTTFLDLDADALLLRFADALQAQHRERHPEKLAGRRAQPVIPQSLPILRMFIAGDLVFGISMIVLLVVFAVWGISRVIIVRSQQAAVEATAPSISEALIGTPEETLEVEATLILAEDTPLPDLADETVEAPIQATLVGNVNVQVNIVALERAYLLVTVDGEVAFDGRTIPGAAYPFEAEQSIEVVTGNASALRIIYNQRDLGLLGGFGQLANYVYTADEILVPTPASSPIPTVTLFVTPTPSATPSPTPTSSPDGDQL